MMSDCGTCTLCCKIMGVPELNKLPGEWCQHVDPKKGCMIYDDRPQVCIDFECLWLQAQVRDDNNMLKKPELRPDKCKGVVVTSEQSMGIVVKLDPHRPNAYKTGPLKRLLDSTPKLAWLVQVAGVRNAIAVNETAVRLCYKLGLTPTNIRAKDDWIEDEIRSRRGNTK